MGVSKSVLEWREGDPITAEHIDALAAHLSNTFNLSAEDHEQQRRQYASLSTSQIGAHLAVLVGTALKMDARTFRKEFPTISQSDSMAVQTYLETADDLASRSDRLSQLRQERNWSELTEHILTGQIQETVAKWEAAWRSAIDEQGRAAARRFIEHELRTLIRRATGASGSSDLIVSEHSDQIN